MFRLGGGGVTFLFKMYTVQWNVDNLRTRGVRNVRITEMHYGFNKALCSLTLNYLRLSLKRPSKVFNNEVLD